MMQWKRLIAISAALSGLLASYIVYAAINHNPMGAYCTNPGEVNCNLDYLNLLGLWGFWFIPALLAVLVSLVIVSAVKGRYFS